MKYGLQILVIESPMMRIPQFHFDFGWGNGYVLMPKKHPYYERHYNDLYLSVHGGLTYSDYFSSKLFLDWIGNRNYDGDIDVDNYKKFDNYWMIGFDTGHFGDDSENCSKEFVLEEANKLLEQCLDNDIYGMFLYKATYERKDKLKKINASVLALSSKQ